MSQKYFLLQTSVAEVQRKHFFLMYATQDLLYAVLVNPERQSLHLAGREIHSLVAFATHTDFSGELSSVALCSASPRQPV